MITLAKKIQKQLSMKTIIIPIFIIYIILGVLGKNKIVRDYIQPMFLGCIMLYFSYDFYIENVEFQKWFHNPLSAQAIYIFSSLGMFCLGFFLIYIAFDRTKVYFDSKKHDQEHPLEQKK